MKRLNLPMAPLKLTRMEGKIYVHCQIRKKNLVLTPEEWVRQHVIHYLITEIQVPIGLLSSEAGIRVNKLDRRCDLLVYNLSKQVKILVECKAPEIPINQKVLHQIAQYNATIQANYLWLTNGLDHHIYHINQNNGTIERLDNLPVFEQL